MEVQLNAKYGLLLGSVFVLSYYLRKRWIILGDTEAKTPGNGKKAVVITGCDSGIGYSFALHCFQSGMTVFAGVLKPKDPGLDYIKAVATETGRIVLFELDLTKTDTIEQAQELIEKNIADKGLDLTAVINNAGVMVFGEFEWQTDRLIEEQMSVNLMGAMKFTRRMLPLLRAHKGRLVNVCSHCSFVTLPGLSVYSASKAAMSAWSDGLRLEMDKFGVKVIKIIPGSFVTQSRILSRQAEFNKAMRADMSVEASQVYGEYFERWAEYFEGIRGGGGDEVPMAVEAPSLYKVLDSALHDPRPSVQYTLAPLRYSVYHTLFSLTPVTSLRDALVRKFASLPQWNR